MVRNKLMDPGDGVTVRVSYAGDARAQPSVLRCADGKVASTQQMSCPFELDFSPVAEFFPHARNKSCMERKQNGMCLKEKGIEGKYRSQVPVRAGPERRSWPKGPGWDHSLGRDGGRGLGRACS